MKELFFDRDGKHVWLESFPALEPAEGYQVRYLISLPDGTVKQFGRFQIAQEWLRQEGTTHAPREGFPFGFTSTMEYATLYDLFAAAQCCFSWQPEETAEGALGSYVLFKEACDRYDLSHPDQSGIEYQLMQTYCL